MIFLSALCLLGCAIAGFWQGLTEDPKAALVCLALFVASVALGRKKEK